MRLVGFAEDSKDDAEERDGERSNEKGDGLGSPKQTDKHQQCQAVLLLGLLHEGYKEQGKEDGEDDDESHQS